MNMHGGMNIQEGKKPVFVYRQGVGNDPGMVQVYADVYGWDVQWPEKNVQNWYDPVGSLLYSVLALCWFAPAWCWAFPRRKWVAVVCVAAGACMLAVVGNAATVTETGPGEYLVSWPAVNGTWQAVVARKVEDFPNGAIAWTGVYHLSNGNWPAGSANMTVPEGESWMVSFFYSSPGSSGPYSGPVDETYSITFTLPANPNNVHVTYQAVQNGETVGQYQQGPGASQALWQITGLESDDPVTLQEVIVVTEYGEDPLNPGHYIPTSVTVTGVATHGTGIPAVSPPVVPSPPPPQTSSTTVPSPGVSTPTPAPGVTAPTAAPGASGPVPFSTPFGTTETSDTSGAKTQDVANAANATVEALSDLNVKMTENTNGIITAINTAAASATTNANGIITAINTGNAATVGGLNGVISALNSLKAQLAAQEAKEGAAAGVSAPQGLTDPSGQEAVWQPGELNIETMVSGKLPQAPTINPSVSSSSTIAIEFEIPVPGASAIQVSKVIDFAAPPFAAPIAIFRTMMNVFVTLGFYILTFYTVRGAFTTAK